MRQRNPDMEAYRDWQADRNDRDALQRYLLSMDRGREVMIDPEDIIDLESRLEPNDPLRQVYVRVRPDYSDEPMSFEEGRWQTLLDRYARRKLDPEAILILVHIGLRSGLPIRDVYQNIYEKRLIRTKIYRKIQAIQQYETLHDRNAFHRRNESIFDLGNMGQAATLAIPQIIHAIRHDSDIFFRIHCSKAIRKIGQSPPAFVVRQLNTVLKDHENYNVRHQSAEELGKIYPPEASTLSQLGDSLLNDEEWSVRRECANALGQIGPSAASAVPQLIRALQNDPVYLVRFRCATALGKIKTQESINQLIHSLRHEGDYGVRNICAKALGDIVPSAAVAIPQLIDSLKNDAFFETRLSCAVALGRIGPAAKSAVPDLLKCFENSMDSNMRDRCRVAIEQITREHLS